MLKIKSIPNERNGILILRVENEKYHLDYVENRDEFNGYEVMTKEEMETTVAYLQQKGYVSVSSKLGLTL